MPAYRMTPACTDYLWGGDKLRTEFGVVSDKHPLAEAWVLSCHPDGPSRLPDGTPLPDFIAAHPGCAGTRCAAFDRFPVLIKLIDAKENLSLQVHPGDDYALAHEGQGGKTEMWLVLDAEPGAFLYHGFDHEISAGEFARRIADNTLTEVLNAVPVRKGDRFFIPAGTLHAIGKGIVIAEVQQSSNVTYRVYDYGRVGPDGNPRALHVEKALEVTDRRPPRTPDFGPHLGQCPWFTTDVAEAPFARTVDGTSFLSVLVLEGSGTLELEGETLPLAKGDSIFVSAGSGEVRVTGSCRLLLTRV